MLSGRLTPICTFKAKLIWLFSQMAISCSSSHRQTLINKNTRFGQPKLTAETTIRDSSCKTMATSSSTAATDNLSGLLSSELLKSTQSLVIIVSHSNYTSLIR